MYKMSKFLILMAALTMLAGCGGGGGGGGSNSNQVDDSLNQTNSDNIVPSNYFGQNNNPSALGNNNDFDGDYHPFLSVNFDEPKPKEPNPEGPMPNDYFGPELPNNELPPQQDNPAPIPEPATLTLLTLGAAGIMIKAFKQKAR